VRLIPQLLRALHLELFTGPSGSDFLRDHQQFSRLKNQLNIIANCKYQIEK